MSMSNLKPARGLRAVACAGALCISSLVHAGDLDIDTATIADLNKAFSSGLPSEKVVRAYLKRIDAYDKKGPAINAVITLNPRAVETARTLDAERRHGKVRGPLHGVPIVLKDNYDTTDLQTTGGSQLLEGSLPQSDAYVVRKLRDAGAIILAKVNMSEWAGGAGTCCDTVSPQAGEKGDVPNGFSSSGGQTLNPHDLARGPSGSSGGTGAAVAAAFAQGGLGTDTGGSIRGPASANGIVGLKPTNGLLSRNGIIPLSLTFDTGGPMARSVYDVAVLLGPMTGVDPADPVTSTSAGKSETDYTHELKTDALKGARIGVARDFMGQDAETDRIIEQAIATLKARGAVIVDPVRYPKYVLDGALPILNTIFNADFKTQIGEYLQKNTAARYPRTFADIVERSNDPATHYRSPGKAWGLTYNQKTAVDQTDPIYVAAATYGIPMIRAGVSAVFENNKLDAIIYPTGKPASLINPPKPERASADSAAGVQGPLSKSPDFIANIAGFPDLVVPAGMTKDGLPVTISFFGTAYSDGKLLGYGYDFEQATKARVLPKNTPPLPTDHLKY